MTFFDPADIAALRDDQASALPSLATIQEGTPTDGGTGISWATFASQVPCRLIRTRPTTVVIEGRAVVITRVLVGVARTQAVPTLARLVVEGQTLQVVGPAARGSAAYETLRVLLTEVVA